MVDAHTTHHIAWKTTLFVVSISAMLLSLIVSASVLVSKVTTPAGLPAPSLSAQGILVATNASRAHEGLMPLALDSRLTAAAQDKLADMIRRHYFGHKTPDGKYIFSTLVQFKCAYHIAGENLASGLADESALERSWMGSAPHRANILNARYTLAGIAVSQDPLMAVVLFADTCG